ncbi:P-loop NTPase [Campylobacter sputorum]|uniref:P-loop NTPase n=1 Tax=Campylobacter sputorum TaxID=206 RepID=UPI000B7706D9|nr:P-loop NTPase [Campylobacter sputorum]ASM36463.1 flagellar biosynthesis protein [Campylobacter sputorum bv. faecalis CCUG 20703]
MINQANKLQNLVSKEQKKQKTTHFIAITSGKGGVGKSTISANLGNILANNGYKVGLFDADIGLANLDVILNVKMNKNLLNVLKGECSLSDIIIPVKKNLVLIPGDSGDEILKYNDHFLYDRFLGEVSDLDYLDFLIIDTGAGIGDHIQVFLQASDEVIVVTVPDPAAITDAYATIKVTSKIKNDLLMIINMAKDEKEAIKIFENIQKVALNNIANLNLSMLGYIQNDKNVAKSIKQRTLFTQDVPFGVSSSEIKQMASKLLYRLERKVLVDDGRRSISNFFKQLMDQF